jgi:hypothetical protein
MAVASIAVRPLGGTSAVPAVPPEGDQAVRKPTEKIEPLGLPNVDRRHVLRELNGLPLMVHALRGLRLTYTARKYNKSILQKRNRRLRLCFAQPAGCFCRRLESEDGGKPWRPAVILEWR